MSHKLEIVKVVAICISTVVQTAGLVVLMKMRKVTK